MIRSIVLLISAWILSADLLWAQAGDPSILEPALQGMAKQIAVYPQEKIHLHLDRSTYYPGDSIRFRAYMVHGTFHTPMHQSRYIYTELIDPFNVVISKVRIRDTDTTTMAGYVAVPDDLPAGNYMLRAYTSYMATDSIPYFYSRNVKIIAPDWAGFDIRAQRQTLNNKGSALSLSLWDRFSAQQMNLTTATAKLANGAIADIPIAQNKLMPAFKPKILEDNRSMLLEVTDANEDRYRKYVPLSADNEDFAITFYPEGGYLLQNVACRVGFKAIGRSGQTKQVSVEILDDRDSIVAEGQSLYAGLGSFTFTPQAGRTYRARAIDKYGTESGEKLPEALIDGTGLAVTTTDSTFVVTLNTTGVTPISAYLVAHIRGAVLYAAPWQANRKSYIFDKRGLPSGLVQFLLLDEQWNPLAERLAFSIRDEERGRADIQTTKNRYEKRDEVDMSIGLTNAQGVPLQGDFSIAVIEKGTGMADTAHSILASFLLSSELRGTIDKPAFYLQQDSLSTAALDLLLLVHGWRRYNLPAVLKGMVSSPLGEPEQSMKIAGHIKAVSVFDWGRDYAVRIRGVNNTYKNEVKTDNKRTFVFDQLEYPEGAGFYISAVKKGEYFPDGNRFIIMDKKEEVPVENDVAQDPVAVYSEKGSALVDTIPEVTRRGRDFLIKPVQVYAPYWGSTEYIRFRQQEVGRMPYHDMIGLLKHMGLRISTDFIYHKQVRLAVFVNGEPMRNHSNVLYELKLSDLEEIIYLPFVAATALNRLSGFEMGKREALRDLFDLYPKEEGMPALNIITKESFDTRLFGAPYSPRLSEQSPRSTIYPLGYQPPVEFYQPIYDTPKKREDPTPDQRETIYWNPALKPDATGKTTLSFYTSDEPGTYTVIVEGISDKGEMVHEKAEIEVTE